MPEPASSLFAPKTPSLWWQWTVPVLCLTAALLIWLLDLNQSLFLWINQLGLNQPANTFHDRFWASATLFGDTLAAFTLLALFLRKRPDIVWTLFLAALFTTAWVHGLKNGLDVLRPLAVLGQDSVHVIGASLNKYSFPSGHTATAFTLASVICLRGVHPALATTALLLAILAGVSRAMVGAHWPIDILAGALGGWLAALIGVRLYARWPLAAHPVTLVTLTKVLTIILLSCALSLLLIHDSGYPLAQPMQLILASTSLAYLSWHIWQMFQSHRSPHHSH